ncbi:4Fe-4S binding protein [Dehalobacter sp. DCM]|uniref:4Fe-4S binding protein n=1 Tax=Dehalobacter sp. DCM TaxID=2907827 RepID=UPI00308151C5|nr:4Fe-4S binding protein [Dehalobacter sp. DCM]
MSKHKTSLSLSNRIRLKTAVTEKTWNRTAKLFRRLVDLSINKTKKEAKKLAINPKPSKPKKHPDLSQGYILNLNLDVKDLAEDVVMPIELMKKIVRESSLRVILNNCLCRSSYECKDYPHDLGCIFLGEGGRGCIERGVGREATVEEALAHIEKGAEMGLIGQALWVGVEKFIWGILEDDMTRWLEICFCCPCCCGALQTNRALHSSKRGAYTSIGWKAVHDDQKCIRCGACKNICPAEAICWKEDQIVIDNNICLGCGRCADKCLQKANVLHLMKPVKEDIKQYFAEGGLNLDL